MVGLTAGVLMVKNFQVSTFDRNIVAPAALLICAAGWSFAILWDMTQWPPESVLGGGRPAEDSQAYRNAPCE